MLTIAEKGLASAEAARLEITAFYLAQEAIEYVRNVRDTNALAGYGGTSDWLIGDEDISLLDTCFAPEGCGVDPTAPADTLTNQQTVPCESSNGQCTLYQYTGVSDTSNNGDCAPYQLPGLTDSRKGLFGHRSTTGWEKTCFTRKVFLEEIEDNTEASVTVRVTWKAGSLGDRTITVNEHLFNWYESN